MKKIKDISELIDSGTKIFKIDELNNKIYIIEGIVISENKPEILISKYKVEFDDNFNTLKQTSKFKDALYMPTKKGVILIDIVDYSKGNSLYFAAILSIFNKLIKRIVIKLEDQDKFVDQIIPTGDGCYLVFNEKLNENFFKIVLMTLKEMNELQNEILKKYSKKLKSDNKLHLRISCTLNEIDYFYDVSGSRNCYGIALNEASRIMTSGQDILSQKYPNASSLDSVFFDKTVYAQANSLLTFLNKDSLIKTEIKYLGKIPDKHGLKRQIWWMKNLPVDDNFKNIENASPSV